MSDHVGCQDIYRYIVFRREQKRKRKNQRLKQGTQPSRFLHVFPALLLSLSPGGQQQQERSEESRLSKWKTVEDF
jgi:hypothetical protein